MNDITQAIMDDLVADGFVPGPKVAGIIHQIVENVIADKTSLEKENANLRHEVNALRAKCGMGRKYVEWSHNKPTGGCPTSGGSL